MAYTYATPGELTIADIQDSVCDYFGLSAMEMVSARRSRYVARPRQMAMYLAKELTPRSLPQIGRAFGNRDHTTVIHAIRQIERLRAEDPSLDKHVRALTSVLTPKLDTEAKLPTDLSGRTLQNSATAGA